MLSIQSLLLTGSRIYKQKCYSSLTTGKEIGLWFIKSVTVAATRRSRIFTKLISEYTE